MRVFVINHRRKGQTLFHGFNIVKALAKAEAVAKATALWIESWNLAFPHNPNGESEAAKMEFVSAY